MSHSKAMLKQAAEKQTHQRLRLALLGLLLTALLVSAAGDEIALVALTLRIASTTGSGLAVALLMATGLVPAIVLAPIVGRMVDELPRTPLLIALLVLEAFIAVSMAFASSPWFLIALAVGLGCLAAGVNAAVQALVPALVSSQELGRAMGLTDAVRNIGFVGGPGLGGILVAKLGSIAAFIVNAASFGFAALAAAFLAAAEPTTRFHLEGVQKRTPNSMASGIQLIWRAPMVRTVIVVLIVTVLASSMVNVSLVFFVQGVLRAGASVYGLLASAWGLGLVVGPLVATRLQRQHRLQTLALLGAATVGAGLSAAGALPVLVAVLPAFVLSGIGNGVQNVSMRTLLANHFPTQTHGRVFATYIATMNAAVLAGFFLAGWLGPGLSRFTILGGGSATVLSALVALLALRTHANAVTAADCRSPSASQAESHQE